MRPSKVIGVTGTIASGKSTACRYLEEHYGIKRIDADQVGHEVTRSSEVVRELTKAFGKAILDSAGKLDRKSLGRIVFRDPDSLKQLNEITHPVICQQIEEEVKRFREDPGEVPCLLLEAIELLRTPLLDLVDEVWVVWAEDEIRVRRVMQRQNLTREEAEDRVRGQWSQDSYMAAADVLIDGSGSVEALYRELDRKVTERMSAFDGKE
ncbi:MAG TPA: dephospho-CoA kinase [Candidatus Faecimorpha stercoravium]|nr:dephospho-CoA kinase [Candidatus Faecimorpha stercoravium]